MGEEHLSCGMKMEAPGCEDESAEDHHCCKNEYTQVNTDDHFSTVSYDVKIHHDFVLAFVSVFAFQQLEKYPDNSNFFTEYIPPPLDKDIPVWHQVFLI